MLNKSIVLGSEAARMKRQQIKVLKAILEHHESMKSFNQLGDHRVQQLITDYLKPRSEMKKYPPLCDIERYELLKRPGPRTPDVAVDSLISFSLGGTLSHYQKYIEEEEEKAHKFAEKRGTRVLLETRNTRF